MNDTDSPVQYCEPSFCPFNGEPGSRQFTKTRRRKKESLGQKLLVLSCMPVFGEVATCKNFSVFCSVFFFSLISFFSLFKTILKTVKLPTLCHVFSSIYQLFVRIMISFRHLLIYVHLLTIGIRMNCETRGSNSPQFSCLFIVLI